MSGLLPHRSAVFLDEMGVGVQWRLRSRPSVPPAAADSVAAEAAAVDAAVGHVAAVGAAAPVAVAAAVAAATAADVLGSDAADAGSSAADAVLAAPAAAPAATAAMRPASPADTWPPAARPVTPPATSTPAESAWDDAPAADRQPDAAPAQPPARPTSTAPVESAWDDEPAAAPASAAQPPAVRPPLPAAQPPVAQQEAPAVPRAAASAAQAPATSHPRATQQPAAQRPAMPAQPPAAQRPTMPVQPVQRHAPPASAPSLDDDMAWFDEAPAAPAATPARRADASAPLSDEEIAGMDWPSLRAAQQSCTRCSLCKTRGAAVTGRGDEQASWVILDAAPNADDEEYAEPVTGNPGRLLDNMLRAVDQSTQQGAYITTLVKCRPQNEDGSQRAPTPAELEACRPFLDRELQLTQAKVMLAIGHAAGKGLLGAAARGRIMLYRDAPVVATFHPADLLHRPEEKAKAWADLCLAKSAHAGRR